MRQRYEIDQSAILFLSQLEPNHSNVYRFAAELDLPVEPEVLQQAVEGVYKRFPTIFAGFERSFFSCRMVPAREAPRVRKDPGMLKTMDWQELERCAYRVYYGENQIIIEAFHALTDGYGAIASLRTIIAEYLHLTTGVINPEQTGMLQSGEPDWDGETRDSYLEYSREAEPKRPRNRKSYQVEAKDRNWRVKADCRHFSTEKLLAAARCQGVSLTVLLSVLIAESVMELQKKDREKKRGRPVRIMVPIDLRRLFPSRTFRNFILYALPSMEWRDADLPRQEHLKRFQEQMRAQCARSVLAAQIAANSHALQSPLYRILPWKLKCAVLCLAYRFFGETNSSITLTNLGSVQMSEELKRYIRRIEVCLTPRRRSPYNFSMISLGDVTCISISRFGKTSELEDLFFGKLHSILN